MLKKIGATTALLLTLPLWLFSQENSPYSRFGLGDLSNTKNAVNRAMGGVAAAYSDFQSVNFLNPASYSSLRITTFDIGTEINNRTLKDIPGAQKYTSSNLLVNYIQIGIPLLNNVKAFNKQRACGLNFGLQPMTRVSYKIETTTRQIDSVGLLNEGSGGSYYAFAGTGYKIKNLSVGINFGYMFGSKDINNRTIFLNDTVSYAKSNARNKLNYGGVYYTLGAQYFILLKEAKDKKPAEHLKLGAYGSLKQNINAVTDSSYETFLYNAYGGTYRVDSVYEKTHIKSTISYPVSYGFGFLYEKEGIFSIGVDYTQSKWSNYTFAGAKDQLTDSWMLHVGAQATGPVKKSKKDKAPVIYRGGFSYGQDIMNVTGKMPVWTVALGAAIPVSSHNRFSTQFTVINSFLEFGSRGQKSNIVKENFIRVGVGFSLSDLWFRKLKYQ
ncbi:MAG: hypothetical protein HYR66_09785 [Sphingobacteriales bacterium]|nr:hypothetical protein [Sphingobacteriales bacterium]